MAQKCIKIEMCMKSWAKSVRRKSVRLFVCLRGSLHDNSKTQLVRGMKFSQVPYTKIINLHQILNKSIHRKCVYASVSLNTITAKHNKLGLRDEYRFVVLLWKLLTWTKFWTKIVNWKYVCVRVFAKIYFRNDQKNIKLILHKKMWEFAL